MGTLLFLAHNSGMCMLCTHHGEVQVECAPCALAMEIEVQVECAPCALAMEKCRSSVLLVHSPWRGAGRVCSLCTRHGEVQVECAP